MAIQKKSTATVDGYIKGYPTETQAVLKKIRAAIAKEMPKGVDQVISYGVPTFKLDGKYVIYFGGYAKHVSVYPVPKGSAAFQKAIAPYVAGKGTIKFPLSQPVPYTLITRIAKEAVKSYKARVKARKY